MLLPRLIRLSFCQESESLLSDSLLKAIARRLPLQVAFSLPLQPLVFTSRLLPQLPVVISRLLLRLPASTSRLLPQLQVFFSLPLQPPVSAFQPLPQLLVSPTQLLLLPINAIVLPLFRPLISTSQPQLLPRVFVALPRPPTPAFTFLLPLPQVSAFQLQLLPLAFSSQPLPKLPVSIAQPPPLDGFELLQLQPLTIISQPPLPPIIFNVPLQPAPLRDAISLVLLQALIEPFPLLGVTTPILILLILSSFALVMLRNLVLQSVLTDFALPALHRQSVLLPPVLAQVNPTIPRTALDP